MGLYGLPLFALFGQRFDGRQIFVLGFGDWEGLYGIYTLC